MRELSLTNCRLDKRYDVEERLGQGSYAEIFVARDILASTTSPHSRVVVKALNVFLQDDLDSELERTLVENFQNEAIALDRVRHPNIISRLGHGTARDLKGRVFHYLVLEFMPGGDLQKACRDKTLSLKEAVGYIEQVCAGLKHAHRQNVIHRDIKPQNLLLTKDRETVKITDFGVARIHVSDSPITRVGTNVYAPPEHSPMNADGDFANAGLSPASDIYSLAKSTYTLLTCEAPRIYAGRQIIDLPITLRDEPWAQEFLNVARRATSDDPLERQQSVDEFWSDLGPLRRLADDSRPLNIARTVMNTTPQAHVGAGFSPMAPNRPAFSTSRDLHLKFPLTTARPVIRVELGPGPTPIDRSSGAVATAVNTESLPDLTHAGSDDSPVTERVRRQRSRKFAKRLAAAAIFLAMFGGGLYAASTYLRGINLLSIVTSAFTEQTGRANTDVNLRPAPSAANEPVGLVTQNSRLRIVKTQNNWYQVEVLEQGRDRDDVGSAKGWINGKYVDLDN